MDHIPVGFEVDVFLQRGLDDPRGFLEIFKVADPSGEQGLVELLEMLTRTCHLHILFPNISCFSTRVALSEDKVPLVPVFPPDCLECFQHQGVGL